MKVHDWREGNVFTCRPRYRSSIGSRIGGITLLGILLAMASPLDCRAATDETPQEKRLEQLSGMSLQELLKLKVTSVSRVEERWVSAPAAVTVITAEDIRRSGFTSIPEALRLVPGMDVARLNSNRWAVSARGFNSFFSSKLLVLIDGRSVYTSRFSGVYWDVQDVVLEDIDRIEVIRGPGASTWGANAVNGVVNIITKPASRTQGVLFEAGGGTEERAFGTMRYGGKVGDDLHYRVYGKYRDMTEFEELGGGDGDDEWQMSQAGARIDWSPTDKDRITLQGDGYEGDAEVLEQKFLSVASGAATFVSDTETNGGNVLTRWTHDWSETNQQTLQFYYDHARRNEFGLNQVNDTIDFDFRQVLSGFERTQIVWGLGYRRVWDDTTGSTNPSFEPDDRVDDLFSGFLQFDARFFEEKLRLMLGSKLEHNDYTGWEVQPSARLAWTPVEEFTLWSAVSRAVRTPARADHDMRINRTSFTTPGGTVLLSSFGNRSFHSEVLYAYEAGIRWQPIETLHFDLAAFYNDYDHIASFTLRPMFPEATPAPPHLVMPFRQDNHAESRSSGGELLVEWQALPEWRLRASYALLRIKSAGTQPGADPIVGVKQNPKHQVMLQSRWNPIEEVDVDLLGFYTSKIASQFSTQAVKVSAYWRLDMRVAWRPADWLELSVIGQNLTDSHHPEFYSGSGIIPTEVPRGVYGKVSFRY